MIVFAALIVFLPILVSCFFAFSRLFWVLSQPIYWMAKRERRAAPYPFSSNKQAWLWTLAAFGIQFLVLTFATNSLLILKAAIESF